MDVQNPGGIILPPASQNAALAGWKGLGGKEMPPEAIGRRKHPALAQIVLLLHTTRSS